MERGMDEKTLERYPIKDLSNLYRLYLGDNFQFAQNIYSPKLVAYDSIYIIGRANSVSYDVLLVASLEELENVLPTRLSAGTSLTMNLPVLAATAVGSLPSATFNRPTLPGYLYLTLANSEYAGMRQGENFFPNEIVIIGITVRGLEETEIVTFPGNMMIKTAKRYTRITKVISRYIQPSTATIQIDDAVSISQNILDTEFIVNIDRQDHQIIWNLDNMVLSSQIASAVGLQAVELITDIAWQLGDDTGTALTGTGDLAFFPRTNYLVVLNDNVLHFYDKRQSYPSSVISNLKEQTNNCLVVLDSSTWNCLPDEIVAFRPVFHLLGRNVRQFRYRIAAPGSSFDFYKKSGDQLVISTNMESWIYNDPVDFKLPQEYLSITLDTPGYWTVALDVIYDNGEMSTDVRLIGCLVKSALVSLSLPEELDPMGKVLIDDSNCLWVADDTTVYQINLHYDYGVLDFGNKTLYLLERYDQIEVS
jgi:hypothetical protein